MAKLLVEGKKRLHGEVEVQGAKNSALPILASSILCSGESLLHNCPDLSDVDTSLKILRYLGCKAQRQDGVLCINADAMCRNDVPIALMREMRSSIIFLGAIIARAKKARLSFPGGCEIGPRPIDLHLMALRQMGAQIEEKHGILECTAPNGLKGAKIALSFPSVGATENVIISAVLAKGTTTLTNAAREPEITDLADFLNECGAKIYGAGESTVIIDGVEKLNSCQHFVIPDRIVATTLMAAAAITGSDITLKNIVASHLETVVPVFEEAGCDISISGSSLTVSSPVRLRALKTVRTMPYPGFPTDAQAPVMAMTCMANGTSVFVENIFESRYRHVGELTRLGANIKVEGKVAVVEGVKSLSGAAVEALDLRGAASLLVASLAAEGITELGGVKYLERGYQSFETVLTSLGASVRKV